MNAKLNLYYNHLKEVSTLQSALALLQWDQEVNLPPKAIQSRSDQIALLSVMSHKKFLSNDFIKLTRALNQDNSLSNEQQRSVRRTMKSINKNINLKNNFVEKVSTVTSKVFHSWIDARNRNNSTEFFKHLEHLIEIKKTEIELKYPQQEAYNGFLDEHDEGTTTEFVDAIFSELLPGIDTIMSNIQQQQRDDDFLHGDFNSNKQWEVGLNALKICGFDFEAGRQDRSEHPFTISLGAGDIRITTRINENYFPEMFWSSMHELGHALYEQGLNKQYFGAPESEACSISIHESQSRFWENHIGRSKAFIDLILPELQNAFPKPFETISTDQLFNAINRVEPGLIRTSADELTYHKHIFIRYQLEKDLFSGKLKTRELKDAWNAMYKQYIGIEPDSDNHGVLQDVHWAHGSFGYFPTYTLGSLYAARFENTMRAQMPEIFKELNPSSFVAINQWLKTNIFNKGRLFDSDELCMLITGKSLDAQDFLNYGHEKYNCS